MLVQDFYIFTKAEAYDESTGTRAYITGHGHVTERMLKWNQNHKKNIKYNWNNW